MRLRLPYLLLLTCLIFGSTLQASSWTGLGMTGNWTDAGNWSGNQVPGPGDAAYIGTGFSPYVTTPVSVGSLVMNAAALYGPGSVTVTGSMSLDSSSISVATFLLQGTSTLITGTFGLSANLTNYGEITNNTYTICSSCEIFNYGTYNALGGYGFGVYYAPVTFQNHGLLKKPAIPSGTFTCGIELKNYADGDVVVEGGELFTPVNFANYGDNIVLAGAVLNVYNFQIFDGTTVTGAGQLKITGNGAYALNSDPVQIDIAEVAATSNIGGAGPLTFTQHVIITGGAYGNLNTFASSCTVDVNPGTGATITNVTTNNGHFNLNANLTFSYGSLVNNGVLSLTGPYNIGIIAAGPGIYNHGTVIKPGSSQGTFTMNFPLHNESDGELLVQNGELYISDLDNTGHVDIAAGTSLRTHQTNTSDGATFTGAGLFKITENGLYANNTAPVSIDVAEVELESQIGLAGPITFTHHVTWLAGGLGAPVTFATGSVIDIDPGNNYGHGITGELSNYGTVNFNSGLTFSTGSLTNYGLIALTGPFQIGIYAATAGIFNHGTVQKPATSPGTFNMGIPLTNYTDGTVMVENGELYVGGGLYNYGHISIATDAILSIHDLLVYDGMTVTGGGTLKIANNGMIAYNTAPLTFDVANVDLQSNVQGQQELIFNGHINWFIGTCSSPTTIGATGVLDLIPGGYHQFFNTLTINGTMNCNDVLSGSGILNNNNVININAPGTYAASYYGSTTLNNVGTIWKNTMAGDVSLECTVNNTGTIHCLSDNLHVTGSLINAGTVEVSAGANVQIDGYGISSLEAASTITGAGSFTVSANLAVNADLNIDVQTFILDYYYGLTGTGILTFAHDLEWRGGGVENTIVIAPGGLLNISGSDYGKALLGTLNNNGTVYCSADLTLNAAALINNNGDFHLSGDHSLGSSYSYFYSGQFNNAGNLDKTSAGTTTFNLFLNNENSGSLAVNGGTLDVAKLDNAGSVTIAASALLIIRDGNNLLGSSLAGNGTLRLAGNGWTLASTLVVSSLALEIQANLNGAPGASLEVQSQASWLSGNLNVPVNVATTGTFDISGYALRYLLQPLTNAGTVHLSTTFIANADINNSGAFLLTGDNGGFFSSGGYHFTNTGTVQSSTIYTSYFGMPTVNNGSIDIQSAILSFFNGLTNNAAIAIAGGATLEVSDVSSFNAGSSVTGPGSINAGGTLSLLTGFAFSGENFRLSGDLLGPNSLTINTHMDWNGGNIETDVTIASGATLDINNGGGGNSSKLAVSSNSGRALRATITNNGTTNQNGNYDLDAGIFLNNGQLSTYGSTLGDGGNGGTLTNNGTWSLHYSFNCYVNAVNNGLLNGEGNYLSFEPELVNNGSVSPGFSPGEMHFYHNYSNGTELDMEVESSAGPGTGHDYVQAEENLQLGGALVVSETGSPLNGEYVILHCNGGSGCRTGIFASTDLPADYTLRYTGNEVILTKGQPATVSPSDTTICSGNSVILSASAGDSYQWSTGESTQSIEVFPYNTTTYYVTVYDGNGSGSLGHATIQVNPAPYVYVYPGSAMVCQGESVTLNAYSDATNYLWSTGETTPSITVSPGADTDYSVTVSNAGGSCSATSVASVYFNPNLPTTPNINGVPASICANDYGFYLDTYQDGVYGYWSGNGVYYGYYFYPYGLSGPQELTFTPNSGQCSLPATWTIEVITGLYYADADGDGYGDPAVSQATCTQPAGYVVDNTDCNDNDANVHPGAPEIVNGIDDNCNGEVDENNLSTFYADTDGDGYGDANASIQAASAPAGYVSDNTDCNDDNANVYPGATETCNDLDDNCDGQIDEGVQSTFYADADGDGYGNAASTVSACSAPAGYVTDHTDCNDGNAAIHPGATEICNSADDNCDGQIDEALGQPWYADVDGDGYGDPGIFIVYCLQPDGFVANHTDCDDSNANVHPGAAEICNNLDDDCDGLVDEGVGATWYADTDGDGYGDAANALLACSVPTGYVADHTDCNDNNANVHPGATEICNGLDDDCDGLTDEGVQSTFYADADGDGYGDAASTVLACSAPAGYVANHTDCDDANANVHPGATEICNNLDDDCDGQVDETDLALSLSAGLVSCANGTTTLTATPTGGLAPYQYSLDGSAFTTVHSFTVTAGAHMVAVKDAHNCMVTSSIVIAAPSALLIDPVLVTNIACGGGNSGAIDITVSGGTAPYTYHWSNNKTTQDITGLAAGTYTVTVTAAGGCTATAAATIHPKLKLVVSKTNTNCPGGNDGSATATVTDGTPAYTYAWSTGATTATVTGLTVGSYAVTVTDALSCTRTASVSVGQPAAMVITGVVTPAACNGSATGAVVVSVNNGTLPFSYAWSDGGTTKDRNDLPAGVHTLTVTDAHGCTKTKSFTIGQPTALVLNLNVNDAGCDGAMTLTGLATGGTAPYLYSLDGGNFAAGNAFPVSAGSHILVVQDAHNCTRSATLNLAPWSPITVAPIVVTNVACAGGLTGAIDIGVTGGIVPYTYHWSNNKTTQDLSSLAGGTYTVTVTSAGGCSVTTSATVNPKLKLTVNKTNTTCNAGNDGMATAVATDGTPGYSYAWSTGASTASITGLVPGTYAVTITDALGCTRSANVAVGQPAAIGITGVVTPATCNGSATGTIGISLSNGVEPFTYAWSDGAAAEDRTGLAAGTYSVTVTDVNGCSKSKSFTVGQPTALTLSLAVVNVSCNGSANGKITAATSGGVKFPTSGLCNGEQYCYQWSNGTTSKVVTGLLPGTYGLTVTDANGCQITGTATVTEPALLAIPSVSIELLPNGKYKVTVTASGGSIPYQYKRIPGGGFQNSNVFTNVPAGAYQLVVQDKNLCSTTVAVNVPGGIQQQNSGLMVQDKTDLTVTNGALLYPNPATEAVQVQFAQAFISVDLQVFDSQGRQVLTRHLTDNQTAELDVRTWESGLYFVRFEVDGERFVRRLSVVR